MNISDIMITQAAASQDNILETSKKQLSFVEHERVKEAAKDFEGVLLKQLLSKMKDTIPESDFMDSGASKQIMGMFWSFLGDELADKGGLGLWKTMYKEFTGMEYKDQGQGLNESI